MLIRWFIGMYDSVTGCLMSHPDHQFQRDNVKTNFKENSEQENSMEFFTCYFVKTATLEIY